MSDELVARIPFQHLVNVPSGTAAHQDMASPRMLSQAMACLDAEVGDLSKTQLLSRCSPLADFLTHNPGEIFPSEITWRTLGWGCGLGLEQEATD